MFVGVGRLTEEQEGGGIGKGERHEQGDMRRERHEKRET